MRVRQCDLRKVANRCCNVLHQQSRLPLLSFLYSFLEAIFLEYLVTDVGRGTLASRVLLEGYLLSWLTSEYRDVKGMALADNSSRDV